MKCQTLSNCFLIFGVINPGFSQYVLPLSKFGFFLCRNLSLFLQNTKQLGRIRVCPLQIISSITYKHNKVLIFLNIYRFSNCSKLIGIGPVSLLIVFQVEFNKSQFTLSSGFIQKKNPQTEKKCVIQGHRRKFQAGKNVTPLLHCCCCRHSGLFCKVQAKPCMVLASLIYHGDPNGSSRGFVTPVKNFTIIKIHSEPTYYLVTILRVLGPIQVIPYAICKLDTFPASIMQHIQYLLSFELD